MRCRNCGKTVVPFISLGKLPLGNAFLKREEIPLEKAYPLSAGFCPGCSLVQLMQALPKEILYLEMFYFPSSFESILQESKKMALSLTKRLSLKPKSTIVDIGSSDGYQLQFFKHRDMKVLGIDPALNMSVKANQKGIPTIPAFFDYSLAREIRKTQKVQADLVLCTHLLNHIDDLKDFWGGVKLLLRPKGTALFKFFLQRELDIISHEHVHYFSLLSLNAALRNADLELYDAEISNGALSAFVAHHGIYQVSPRVKSLIAQEMQKGFNRLETYRRLGARMEKLKTRVVAFCRTAKKHRKRIAAYSSPEKGNILLNYCGIGKQYLDFIVDQSELKQGLYTPGTHMLIHSPEKVFQEKPDYLLILCWNIADEILEQIKAYRDAGGKCIVPIPNLKVV